MRKALHVCRSALEILEGEVREERTNERDPGCSAKEDKTLKYHQRTSSVLHKYLVRFLIMRYLMVMMMYCAQLVPWKFSLSQANLHNMYVVVSGANRSHGQSFGTHISFSSCGNHSRFTPAPAGVFLPL
jgi:hypothetical protein